MIISDRLSARAQVAFELSDRPEVIDVVSEQLTRSIIATGAESGAFIRPQSVWIYKGVNDLEVQFGFQVYALWAPDPTEGVMLRGGPHDGIGHYHMRREADGRPARYVDTPSAVNRSTLIGGVAGYVRVGIDSDRDRWVYDYIGSKGGGHG